MSKRWIVFIVICLLIVVTVTAWVFYFARQTTNSDELIVRLEKQVGGRVKTLFQNTGLTQTPRFISLRVYKKDRVLEIWASNDPGSLKHIATYPVCAMDFTPGTKLREGDRRTPEGDYSLHFQYRSKNWFMHINPEKPENRGFLSDPTIYACTDYPVPIDTKLARHAKSNNPGSAICIHGNCVSAGCISMNNADYLEIYYLMAQHSVQRYGSLRIHILPFRFYRDCNADEIGIEELDNRSFCKTDYFAQIEAEAESAASRSPQLQNLGKEIIYKIWMHYAQRELQFLKAPSKDSAELQLTEDVIALLSHNFSE